MNIAAMLLILCGIQLIFIGCLVLAARRSEDEVSTPPSLWKEVGHGLMEYVLLPVYAAGAVCSLFIYGFRTYRRNGGFAMAILIGVAMMILGFILL